MEKNLRQQKTTVLKIVLFGPESTGKTTLSKQLANHYQTVWVPEFARKYLQKKWDDHKKICVKEDIIPIAIGQMKQENKLIKKANKILICDTNLLETKVYSEIYFNGFVDQNLDLASKENHYHLYFLTAIDTPWVADDLRDKPKHRVVLFTTFEKALKNNHCNYIVLNGNKKTRLKNAICEIDKLILENKI